MCIGEPHPLASQTIQIRRVNLRLGVVAAQVAVAQIIGKHNDDVRSTLRDRFLLGECRPVALNQDTANCDERSYSV